MEREYEGLTLLIFRSSIDNQLVVDIDTSELETADTYDGDVPKFRITINETDYQVTEEGIEEI